ALRCVVVSGQLWQVPRSQLPLAHSGVNEHESPGSQATSATLPEWTDAGSTASLNSTISSGATETSTLRSPASEAATTVGPTRSASGGSKHPGAQSRQASEMKRSGCTPGLSARRRAVCGAFDDFPKKFR